MDEHELRERVIELLNYDPETGLFTRRVGVQGGGRAGSVAGSLNRKGYIHIMIDGKFYLAHRLAWLLSHGFIPSEIDHINLIKDDNRIINLRPATRSENQRNTGKYANNTSGFKGVHWDKTHGRWRASAQDANGKQKSPKSARSP